MTNEMKRKHLVQTVKNSGVTDKRVLDAMQKVPRHKFVPDKYRSQAYEDVPLPIGYGQTISQPSLVGLMTQLLKLTKTYAVKTFLLFSLLANLAIITLWNYSLWSTR